MEREIAEHYGFRFASVNARKIPGKNPFGLVLFCVLTIAALIQAMAKLLRIHPAVVIGFGGYVSFPSAVSAVVLGIPIYLQEQNVIPGKVNSKLSRWAKVMFTSFDKTEQLIHCPSLRTGNPTRFEGKSLPDLAVCQDSLGLKNERKTIFVFGGSQGAASINRATIDFAKIEKNNGELQILHIAGRNNYEEVLRGYKNSLETGENKSKSALKVRVLPYLEDMELGYCVADIVVCRAGATAMAEIMEFGKPAILVPYPHAAESHQAENADFLVRKGAAIVIDDTSLTGTKMAEEVHKLLTNPKCLKSMSNATRGLYAGNAASRIVDEVTKLSD